MAKGTNIVKMVSSPEVEEIRSRIYIVRGVPVMFDFDLARYYGIETRVLKQAVRRNRDSFPEDFMFVLSNEEANELIFNRVSQIVTPPQLQHRFYHAVCFYRGGCCYVECGIKIFSSSKYASTVDAWFCGDASVFSSEWCIDV